MTLPAHRATRPLACLAGACLWVATGGPSHAGTADEDAPPPPPSAAPSQTVIVLPIAAPVTEAPLIETPPPAEETPPSAPTSTVPVASVRELEPGAPPQANQRYRTGIEMYVRGDYAGAAREFRVGQAFAPRSPKLAYNLGRSLERAGDVPGAISAYRQYLTLAPQAEDRPAVEQVLRVLEGEGAPSRAGRAPGSEVGAVTDVPPAESDPRVVGAWAAGAGAAGAAIVGAIFAVRAADAKSQAEGLEAGDVERHEKLQGQLDSGQLGTGLGFGLAGALGITAVLVALWPEEPAPTGGDAARRLWLGPGWAGVGGAF